MSSSSKPISVSEFEVAIKELTDDTIVGVQSSLETSLAKLHETNEYLTSELSRTDIEQDDRILYEETVTENNEVISSQQSKLALLKQELRVRGLLSEQNDSEEGVYL